MRKTMYLGLAAVAMAVGCGHNAVNRTENAASDVGHGVASGAESATNEVKCGARDVGQRLAGTHNAGDLRAEEIQRRDCERAQREARQAGREFRAVPEDLRNNGGGKAEMNAGQGGNNGTRGTYGGGPK